MIISTEVHRKKIQIFSEMEIQRRDILPIWKLIADFFLPKRYVWLMSASERASRAVRNPNIIDGTGTNCARILGAGMLNGKTSPARPWFRLKLRHYNDEQNYPVRRWLDEVERLMLSAMSATNFYSCLAVTYLDLGLFGTNATLIYEDPRFIFRCYSASLGEYFLGVDATGLVNRFGREFVYTVEQCIERFGEENVPQAVKDKYKQGGANRLAPLTVRHMVEPNDQELPGVPKSRAYQEMYWLSGYELGNVLSIAGYNEKPGFFPRWEVNGNDPYGTCPGMDALADTMQLQQENRRKAQSLDYVNRPPILADISMQNRPSALLPGGVTFVAGLNNGNVGAKPIYTVNPDINALTMDIREIQQRIRTIFHNDLFTMISNLDTVRTATEIDARREEGLVLLGSVLERFDNEALTPAISRVYGIMSRAGLFPQPPAGLEDAEIEIQYISILSSAQSAVGTAPLERWTQFIAQAAAFRPEALNIPNWDDLFRDYGRDIGVKAKYINSKEESAAAVAAQEEQLKLREAANVGGQIAQGAKTLSETDVGGGANALQQLLSA